MDVDSAMEILLFGLSFYYAAVVTEILALTTMVVAATTAVYGLSFFFSAVAADVVETTAASNAINKKATVLSVASFIS